MNRTPGSWIICQSDRYEVAFVGGKMPSIQAANRKHAEKLYLEAREEYGPDVQGVFRYRTLTEKVCVKGVPFEEQRP